MMIWMRKRTLRTFGFRFISCLFPWKTFFKSNIVMRTDHECLSLLCFLCDCQLEEQWAATATVSGLFGEPFFRCLFQMFQEQFQQYPNTTCHSPLHRAPTVDSATTTDTNVALVFTWPYSISSLLQKPLDAFPTLPLVSIVWDFFLLSSSAHRRPRKTQVKKGLSYVLHSMGTSERREESKGSWRRTDTSFKTGLSKQKDFSWRERDRPEENGTDNRHGIRLNHLPNDSGERSRCSRWWMTPSWDKHTHRLFTLRVCLPVLHINLLICISLKCFHRTL